MTFDAKVVTKPDALGHGPRICGEFVFIETDEGVLVEGLGPVEVIRGPLAQTILPHLITLMDGTRNIAELCAAFPAIPKTHIEKAISLLAEWRLIDNVRDLEPLPGTNLETFASIKRSIIGSKLSYGADEGYVRLQHANVLINTSHEGKALANYVRILLQKSGVGSVQLINRNTLRPKDILKGSLVVAMTLHREEHEWFRELEREQFQQGFSWMRVTLDEHDGIGDVGPVFLPRNNTCYSCFYDVHCGSPGKSEGVRVESGTDPTWASYVALEILNLLALPQVALGEREFRRFHLSNWQSQLLKYPRLPGCTVCRTYSADTVHNDSTPEDFRVQQTTDTALVFEEYVGAESRAFLSSPARADSSEAVFGLRSESKYLPNCKQVQFPASTITLPVGLLDALRNRGSFDRLSVHELAIILTLAAGIREINDHLIRRWTPTAGNLGSVELFVVASNVDDLEPGTYFYQAQEHQLARLHKHSGSDPASFIRRVLQCNDRTPDALVILTGALDRVARKYGSFGYRLVNLDAGACLSQLYLAARGMNIWSRSATRWPDDFIECELDLQSPGELCTGVVALSGGVRKKGPLISFGAQSIPRVQSFASRKMAHQFQGLSLRDVAALVVTESKLKEEDLQSQPYTCRAEFTSRSESRRLEKKLPRPLNGGQSLGYVFANRRSVRAYDASPVPIAHIGTALYDASRTDVERWPEDCGVGLPLIYLVVAKRVTGLDAGVYEYDPSRCSLIRLASALSREETTELLVQEEFADAPFLVWIAGNLVGACARHGAHGHRQLLLRAGAAGHTFLMAALSLNLRGSLVAGLIPGAARKFLGLDGHRRASLLAVAAGNPLNATIPKVNSESDTK